MSDHDLIILGAGPAGLTAAQYGARANLNVLVIEKMASGGQALVIDVLENYPGIAAEKSGYEFAMDLHNQAQAFGASFLTGEITSLKKEGKNFIVGLSDGKTLSAFSVIIATGSKPRLLDVPGEKEYAGRGVSYCATCDGNFFKKKKILVVGGGDAACDEARYLSRLTDSVTLVHRRDSFRAQKSLVERTMNNPNIKIIFNKVIKEIKGEQKVTSVILEDTKTGEKLDHETDAVFVFAGTVPQLSFLKDAAMDESGYIITDSKMATSIEGLYAAGDIRSGAFRQVVTACADGATAAHSAAEYIDRIKG